MKRLRAAPARRTPYSDGSPCVSDTEEWESLEP
jgi:hypothetical protein